MSEKNNWQNLIEPVRQVRKLPEWPAFFTATAVLLAILTNSSSGYEEAVDVFRKVLATAKSKVPQLEFDVEDPRLQAVQIMQAIVAIKQSETADRN